MPRPEQVEGQRRRRLTSRRVVLGVGEQSWHRRRRARIARARTSVSRTNAVSPKASISSSTGNGVPAAVIASERSRRDDSTESIARLCWLDRTKSARAAVSPPSSADEHVAVGDDRHAGPSNGSRPERWRSQSIWRRRNSRSRAKLVCELLVEGGVPGGIGRPRPRRAWLTTSGRWRADTRARSREVHRLLVDALDTADPGPNDVGRRELQFGYRGLVDAGHRLEPTAPPAPGSTHSWSPSAATRAPVNAAARMAAWSPASSAAAAPARVPAGRPTQQSPSSRRCWPGPAARPALSVGKGLSAPDR